MSNARFEAGAASVDITPGLRRPVYLAGFAVNRTATSILHPLQVGALYLKDAQGGPLCFVTFDLIGWPNPLVQRVRSRIRHLVPPERTVICSTHTHSGPDTLGLWGKGLLGIPYRSGIDDDYVAWVVERAGEAVEAAVAACRPVTLAAVGFDTPPHWVRNDRKGGGHYRRAAALAALDGGKPYAVLLNFAAHPEALWEGNRAISPDYPAPTREWMRRLGVEHPLFFTGPIGAMLTPAVAPKATFKERVRYIEFFGKMLARRTVEELDRAVPLDGPIEVATQPLRLVNANKGFELARRLGFVQRSMGNGHIHTEVTVGRIGTFRFATIPGEPSPEVGHEAAAVLGGDPAMLLCLGQDELGYILPADFFRNPEYKYEQSMSVGSHTAPTVVQAIRTLTEQLSHE